MGRGHVYRALTATGRQVADALKQRSASGVDILLPCNGVPKPLVRDWLLQLRLIVLPSWPLFVVAPLGVRSGVLVMLLGVGVTETARGAR